MLNDIHPTKLVLTVLGTPIAAGVGWLCAAIGKYGIHLDKSGVNALAVTGVAGAVGLIAKLIHDVETTNPAVAKDIAAVERAAGAVVQSAEKADPQLAHELAGAWPPAPTADAPTATTTATATGHA